MKLIPPQPVNYDSECESRTLRTLARQLGDDPSAVLQTIPALILELCGASAAGVTTTHTIDGREVQRVLASAGDAAAAANGTVCTPFRVRGQAVGTVWAVPRASQEQPGQQYLPLLESLADFASAAYLVQERAGQLTASDAALQASEERFRRAIDSVTDHAVIIMGVGGLVEFWNTGAERTFGFTEAETLGRTGDVIFTPEDRAKGAPDQERFLAVKDGEASDERWHVRKDGSRLFASGMMSTLRGPRGEVAGFVKVARDATGRKQSEEALQRANDLLESRVAERTAAIESLLERLVTIQEDERRRIARDLHDHLGQQMTALRLNLATMKTRTSAGSGLLLYLDRADAIAAKVDEEVDFLAWELRPASLDDLGLVATLDDFVSSWSKHYGIAAEFHSAGLDELRLPPEIETNLYRIAQEALNNVFKHARARRASVMLEKRDARVVLIVEDDGVGFDVPDASELNQNRGLGLSGMRERAALVDGTLEIETSRGSGTTIFVRVPVMTQSARSSAPSTLPPR